MVEMKMHTKFKSGNLNRRDKLEGLTHTWKDNIKDDHKKRDGIR